MGVIASGGILKGHAGATEAGMPYDPLRDEPLRYGVTAALPR